MARFQQILNGEFDSLTVVRTDAVYIIVDDVRGNALDFAFDQFNYSPVVGIPDNDDDTVDFLVSAPIKIRKFVLAKLLDDETEFIAPFFNICLEILKDARKEGMFKPDVEFFRKDHADRPTVFCFQNSRAGRRHISSFFHIIQNPGLRFGTDSAVV